MKIKVSAGGVVSVPKRILEKFNIRAGDTLDVGINAGRIVLSPRVKPRRRYSARIVHDPVTGMPALSLGPDAPILTNEMVDELLNGTVRDIPDPAVKRRPSGRDAT
jgi:AbrB family looped-hinge helix DNA binding protein